MLCTCREMKLGNGRGKKRGGRTSGGVEERGEGGGYVRRGGKWGKEEG